MLRAVEGGASLTDAYEAALAWGRTHPDLALFERRSYADWRAVHDEDAVVPDSGKSHRVSPTRLMRPAPAQPERPHAAASATGVSDAKARRRSSASRRGRDKGA